MTTTHRRRLLTLALVAVLACSLVAPATATAAVAGGSSAQQSVDTPDLEQPAPTLAVQEDGNETAENATTENATAENETAENESETVDLEDADEMADDGSPGIANRLRITPMDFGEDWLSVDTEDSDEAFNTTGPFAIFALSEPAENVRIEQSAADATLTDGDQTVMVEYDENAADSSTTYFELQLFFDDGSAKMVDLYATDTAVSVAAADLEQYEGLINDMKEGAVDRDYAESTDDATAEDLEDYYEWTQDRVSLIESFLVERAEQLFMLGIMAISNPLVWVLGLLSIIVIAYRRESSHGWILDRIENDAGEASRRHEQLIDAYRQHKQTANEEHITALNEINEQQAVYWKDAFDVYSVHQMAELAKKGPKNLQLEYDDTGAATDGGHPKPAIADLEADEIRESWLAQVFSTNKLSGPREALSGMKGALIRMEATYGMGHLYSETRAEVERLLEELDETEDY